MWTSDLEHVMSFWGHSLHSPRNGPCLENSRLIVVPKRARLGHRGYMRYADGHFWPKLVKVIVQSSGALFFQLGHNPPPPQKKGSIKKRRKFGPSECVYIVCMWVLLMLHVPMLFQVIIIQCTFLKSRKWPLCSVKTDHTNLDVYSMDMGTFDLKHARIILGHSLHVPQN